MISAALISIATASLPAGYNETYGYPDGIGGLIVEGPFPYKGGPEIWSDDDPWGAYGMIVAPGHYDGSNCAAVPEDSPFFGSSEVQPQPLTNGIDDQCMLGCDLDAVKKTGVDPCKAESIKDGSLSNSPFSCFDLGPGMMGGWGACGYNCTAY